MTASQLLIFLFIGLVAGWLASLVLGGRLGLFGCLVVGVIGAFLGPWLLGLLGVATAGLLGSIISAFVGAVALLGLIRLIKRA